MKKANQAVNLNTALESDADMSSRESEILLEISRSTGFIPQENIWRSTYWGKNLGASHWLGIYLGKKSVLKIQGIEPDISEIYMIDEFSKQNRSKLIRPPLIYTKIKWDSKNNYEAIITEYVGGDKVINDGQIISRDNIKKFLSYYQEYRTNCVPSKPWLPKPDTGSTDITKALDALISSSHKAYPENSFRENEDTVLAKEAYAVLSKVYNGVDLEFVHGHFSCKDLIYKDKEKKNVVLFSNLFWKWRYPYFDAVFAYHWFMYELSHVKNITPKEVEEQRKIWIEEIYNVTGADASKKIKTLVDAAFLERSVAGFILDSFLCDPRKEISKYLYEASKNEARRLIRELEK
jgi:hypothetical protein